jgi:type I restriction enzyme, S subunit
MSEWQIQPLGALADIRISNVDKKLVSGELPVRLCNYMDVYAGRYLVDGDRYMEATCTTRELAAFGLRRGDVLITKDSESPDDIAIPALIDDDVQELVCGYHLAVLRLKSEAIDPVVLLKQLESERLRRYFGQRAGGSTRYGLSTRHRAGANSRSP